MSALDSLLDSVKASILDHVQQGGHQNFDSGGLLGKITDLFTQHSRNNPGGGVGAPIPASRDPYGDPADQGGFGRSSAGVPSNVKPASEDPYGDPADQERRGR